MNTESLRHRNGPLENNLSPSAKENTINDSKYNHMAYTRRSIATPFPRGGNNRILPNNSRSLTSYRKNLFVVLIVTSLYTAFLYRRGQWCIFRSMSFALNLLLSFQWSFALQTSIYPNPDKITYNIVLYSLAQRLTEIFSDVFFYFRRSQYIFRTECNRRKECNEGNDSVRS